MRSLYVMVVAGFLTFAVGTTEASSQGSATRGQRLFGACAACHSLQPDQNMTGPSLAGLWNRKAGSVASFNRYSSALQSSNVVWSDKTLDEWIDDPQHLVPGNQMPFQGIKDPRQRADLIAFLKEATKPGASVAQQGNQMRGMGGMMGMMGSGPEPNLQAVDKDSRVTEVTYCKDTYTVVTADGQSRKFWERNLRLMSDSSGRGPNSHVPVILPAGMYGDRADLIFAGPSEISAFISSKC